MTGMSKITGVGIKSTLKFYIKPTAAAAVMTLINLFIRSFMHPIAAIIVFAVGYTAIVLANPSKIKAEKKTVHQ